MTREDTAFLARPLHGFLAVAAAAQPPQPRPVWFEVTTEATLQFFTGPDSPKLRSLRLDPRACLVVAAPVGERERWVSVTARATIEAGGGRELASRLAARYWDLRDPQRAGELDGILAAEQVRVVLHPQSVRRFGTTR
nr:pyridoxamine 5'-phosphate oxidase family protein [Kineococcus vitellinus]